MAPLAALGPWEACAALSSGVALAGGRGPPLRARLRVGGLLLGMTAAAAGEGCLLNSCYKAAFPDSMVTCTAAGRSGPDSGSDSGDSGSDTGDTDTLRPG